MRLVAGLIECLLHNPNDALRVALMLKSDKILLYPLNSTDSSLENTASYLNIWSTSGSWYRKHEPTWQKEIWSGEAINISGRLISEQKIHKER